jgi:hypothetical protein
VGQKSTYGIHTLKISHEGFGTAIQGVDDHLPIGWTGDFDASVLQARSRWGTMPGRLSTDVGRLRGEVEGYPSIEACLSCLTGGEKTLACRVERLVKGSQKPKGTLGENFCLRLGSNSRVDFYAGHVLVEEER